ncbi:Double-stranded RNA-binding protein [Takifugu flavidus]|uniref:Double-stranded RNA-binding protein n=1 Tax=Takifugu flavidus TaxID=433684 RepID=A0A5C6NWH2_9TELE|nr:Double-stranded RNA-binding protein [Takifugu flavidus]
MEASMKHGSNAPTTGTSSGSCLNYIPSKDMGPCSATLPPGHTPYYSGLASSPSPTATMARELLVNGQSPTTDTSLPMKGTNPGLTCGVSVQPAQQLDYLARIQGFQSTNLATCLQRIPYH